MKKKRPITKFSKLEDQVTRIDEKTFYVKSSDPEKEPYMVFHSQNKGWVCDCMSFVMNIKDNWETKHCKHISLIRKSFNLD